MNGMNRRWATMGVVLASLAWGGPAGAADVAPPPKLRVLVETDAGGDPDDEGSLVRFLLYANEWDVQGIIADRPRTDNQGTRSGLELCRKILRAYGDCHANLVRHNADYPTFEQLDARLVAGYDSTDDGVKLTRRVLLADDDRPIWYANWGSNSGTKSNMARALAELERELPAERFGEVLGRLYVTRNAEKVGPRVMDIALFVDTRNPDRWYHRFRALTERAGGCDVKRDIQSVGPLGAVYPMPKEGDSLSFVYLIPTGLSDPRQPTWGGWAGRYAPLTKAVGSSGGGRGPGPRDGFYWASAEDTIDGRTSRDNTLARFAEALQNDFRARMQWSVTASYDKANHEPVVHCQGDATRAVLTEQAKAGQAVALSAAGTRDPDGDRLRYRWWVYPEAGTYAGAADIEDADAERATLRVPDDAAGRTLHVVLEVTDDGQPALTRYRRVVVEVGR